MKKNLIYLLLLTTVFGCKKSDQFVAGPSFNTKLNSASTTDPQFKLEAKNNAGKFTADVIDLTVAGDSIVGVVTTLSNDKSFVLSFLPAGADVKIGNAVQNSGVTANDFTKPLTYTYTDKNGASKTYKVIISNFTGIPIFNITTAGPVTSKDVYVTGSLLVNGNAQYDQPAAAIDLQIKGRGNSTWNMPKKPYKLKFSSKAALLGLPAAKNWVLLANYADKTLMRNAITFELARQVGSDFAPHSRFVEVVMNGEYMGNYTLTEQVEVNPGRVGITELKASNTSADDITGGYLLELDQWLDADKYFRSLSTLPFCIKSPDAITDSQLAYIQNYFNQTEISLVLPNFADPVEGYAKYINVESFINWYLVNEIAMTNDAQDFSSIFYYKDRGGKLGMGPVWDFDTAIGNTDYSYSKYATGWWIRNTKWFGRLFEDPAFKARVRKRWGELKLQVIPNMYGAIDRNAACLNLSQQQNFKKWNILSTYVWPNAVVLGNYPDEVNYMKLWLHSRIDWLDANM